MGRGGNRARFGRRFMSGGRLRLLLLPLLDFHGDRGVALRRDRGAALARLRLLRLFVFDVRNRLPYPSL